jgi:hypothetical protein
VEEQATQMSGSGRATGECWGPIGQVDFGYNFGEKPKYEERVQKEESMQKEEIT